ncbi:MAG: RidA family protein [Firmicutes bacterium]|nr:RidA family protein [Bacillota bacterium]
MDRQMYNRPGVKSAIPASAVGRAGDIIFTAGQTGRNPYTNEIPEGMAAHTRQALLNLKEALELAGSSMDRVVKVNIFITDMSAFEEMNGVYREFFPTDPPARATVEVKSLANPKLVIEIEAVAVV